MGYIYIYIYIPEQQLNVIYPCLSLYRIEYLELGDLGVAGLSKFITNSMEFNLTALDLTVDFTFPLLVDANRSNFSIIVGDLLPFNGGGVAK